MDTNSVMGFLFAMVVGYFAGRIIWLKDRNANRRLE
jgi:hypothetical protein